MFNEFFNLIFRSIKLDKKLYQEAKNFGETGVYYAGLIMILFGVAGAFAASTMIKSSIGLSGLTAILIWFVWAILIFIIGGKIFPEKNIKINFKKVLTAVGYAHSPGILRFFAVTPEMVIPIIIFTQFWIFASLIVCTREILNYKSNFKSIGVVLISFLVISIVMFGFVITRISILAN